MTKNKKPAETIQNTNDEFNQKARYAPIYHGNVVRVQRTADEVVFDFGVWVYGADPIITSSVAMGWRSAKHFLSALGDAIEIHETNNGVIEDIGFSPKSKTKINKSSKKEK